MKEKKRQGEGEKEKEGGKEREEDPFKMLCHTLANLMATISKLWAD